MRQPTTLAWIVVLLLVSFPPMHQALSSSAASSNTAKPIDPSGWPDRFPAKDHCSKCGLCETSFVSQVADACAFLGDGMGRIDPTELKVHGRQRDLSSMHWSDDDPTRSDKDKGSSSKVAEEARFGVLQEPVRLAKGKQIADAQWTGVVRGIALSMLESNMVDAVVCIASSTDYSRNKQPWSYPEPILARTPEAVLQGRGVKPALAPSLRVLDEIQQDPSIRKLLFCGVGCAVQGMYSIAQCYLLRIGRHMADKIASGSILC